MGDREVVSDIASEATGVDFATRLERATRAQVSLDAARLPDRAHGIALVCAVGVCAARWSCGGSF